MPNLVVIPLGSSAEPHHYKGYETAIYFINGWVDTKYGEGLKKFISVPLKI